MKVNFIQAVNLSLKADESKTYECNITLTVDSKTFKAYEVSIAHRDLLFSCDIGTVTYLVDSYGDDHKAVLHDWNEE